MEKKWRAVKSSGGGGGASVAASAASNPSGGGGSSGLFRLKFRRPESRSRTSASQSQSGHRHSDMGSSESGGVSGSGAVGGGGASATAASSAVDPSQISVHLWGHDEVAAWLESLQLEEYRDSFIRHDIRGSELLTLERRDLKELGIHKVGHIKRIQQAILEIKESTRLSHPSA